MIDFDEYLFKASLAGAHIVQQRWDFTLDEFVRDRDGALFVFHVFKRVGKSHLSRIAGFVRGDQNGFFLRRHIVRMREERDVRARFFRPPFVPGEEITANFNPAVNRIRWRFVHNETAAAEVDIRIIRNQLNGRRSDIDGYIFLQNRFIAAKEIPEGSVASADAKDRGSLFHSR